MFTVRCMRRSADLSAADCPTSCFDRATQVFHFPRRYGKFGIIMVWMWAEADRVGEMHAQIAVINVMGACLGRYR